MREPAVLTVSHIRQELFLAAKNGAPQKGGGAIPGRLFHQAAAAMLDADSPAFWERVLVPGNINGRVLAQQAYAAVIGPGLVRYQASMQGSGEQALGLWHAVQAYSDWFCKLVETAFEKGVLHFDPVREIWVGGGELFQSEVPLSANFQEPGWTGRVVVNGRADQLIRAAGKNCIVEFKLGPGMDEADLLQACLYREMLPQSPAIALVRFVASGEVEETLVQAAQADASRPAIMKLIEALAFGQEPPAASAAACWPKPAGTEEVEMGRKLAAAFGEFGTSVKLTGAPLVGPAFVRYFIEAERRTTMNKILKQGMNVQMRLKLSSEPMIHLTDGRIAVDVQRASRESIPFSHVHELLQRSRSNSRVLAGVDLSGQPVFADFAAPEHAHMLVAGVAGSGKTEWLRVAIASLMVQNSSETLRLVLIDPKRNAFPELRSSPFLWRPDSFLCPPQDDAIAMLEALVNEMELRYEQFEKVRADHLADYHAKSSRLMPRIVCVCDEFADMLLGNKGAREEIENAINRLGQKARAAGIHLVLATQRPSRQVVSGILKANLPCRIALRVTDSLESRIILDRNGAETLLGRGDLLFSGGGEPVRLQSPFLETADRRLILGESA